MRQQKTILYSCSFFSSSFSTSSCGFQLIFLFHGFDRYPNRQRQRKIAALRRRRDGAGVQHVEAAEIVGAPSRGRHARHVPVEGRQVPSREGHRTAEGSQRRL